MCFICLWVIAGLLNCYSPLVSCSMLPDRSVNANKILFETLMLLLFESVLKYCLPISYYTAENIPWKDSQKRLLIGCLLNEQHGAVQIVGKLISGTASSPVKLRCGGFGWWDGAASSRGSRHSVPFGTRLGSQSPQQNICTAVPIELWTSHIAMRVREAHNSAFD